MTGLYPSQHGVYNNVSNPTRIHNTVYPGVRMLSQGLRASGCNLAYAGKWHVSGIDAPGDRGWQDLKVTTDKDSYRSLGIELWREKTSGPDEADHRKRGEIFRPGWVTTSSAENRRLVGRILTVNTNPIIAQSAHDATTGPIPYTVSSTASNCAMARASSDDTTTSTSITGSTSTSYLISSRIPTRW